MSTRRWPRRRGGPIQRATRLVELTSLKMGFGNEAEPLGFHQTGTSRVPIGQTGTNLCDPLRLHSEADECSPPTHGSETEPHWQVMLVGDLDGLSARIRATANSRRQLARTAAKPEATAVLEGCARR
jgi:hypothetical protein